VDIRRAINTQMLMGFHSRMLVGKVTVTWEIPVLHERDPT
jgi:hypothetical protein